MATPRICSVDGCGKRVVARGLCGAHYERWKRYGDPQAGRTPNGEVERFYREVVLAYEGDECLIWPYAISTYGYALMHMDGKHCTVSRLVCEEVNGPPPTDKHDAAHSCGKGKSACVTKRHMSWKTRAENHADKIAHGTHSRGEKHGGAKLTNDDVRQIRALKGTMSQRAIAKQFGVDPSTISHIYRGSYWRSIE